MTTIDLKTIDELLLKRIVKKFSATSGANFYRSCKRARDLVDWSKPVWPIPDSSLRYGALSRTLRKVAPCGDWISDDSPTILVPFCRIETVEVGWCMPDFLETVVLPELEALEHVPLFYLSDCSGWNSDEDTRPLLAAAKPEAVQLFHHSYDITSEPFEDVKNLHIIAIQDEALDYCGKHLFELGKTRKTISLDNKWFIDDLVKSFLKTWQKGETTGSLERLTLIRDHETGRKLKKAIRREIEGVLENYRKIKGGYVVEREGGDRVRIEFEFSTEYPKIHLHFNATFRDLPWLQMSGQAAAFPIQSLPT